MVDLLLYFLQMGAADGEDRPVLKNCRPVLNLHYVYQIYDTAPVNKKKFLCVQFLVNLLQAFSHF